MVNFFLGGGEECTPRQNPGYAYVIMMMMMMVVVVAVVEFQIDVLVVASACSVYAYKNKTKKYVCSILNKYGVRCSLLDQPFP